MPCGRPPADPPDGVAPDQRSPSPRRTPDQYPGRPAVSSAGPGRTARLRRRAVAAAAEIRSVPATRASRPWVVEPWECDVLTIRCIAGWPGAGWPDEAGVL